MIGIGIAITAANLRNQHLRNAGGGEDNLFQFDGENFQYDGENMSFED